MVFSSDSRQTYVGETQPVTRLRAPLKAAQHAILRSLRRSGEKAPRDLYCIIEMGRPAQPGEVAAVFDKLLVSEPCLRVQYRLRGGEAVLELAEGGRFAHDNLGKSQSRIETLELAKGYIEGSGQKAT